MTYPIVRTKWKCISKSPDTSGETGIVTLQPVHKIDQTTGNNPENEAFGKWTPSGTLAMTLQNPEAYMAYEVGKEYYFESWPAAE